MFDYVVASLSPEFAEIRDLILRPPAENPYDTVKDPDPAPTPLLTGIHQAQLVSYAHRRRTVIYAGITRPSETPPGNANHPASSRETTRPATDGGQCVWPSSKSPILCD